MRALGPSFSIWRTAVRRSRRETSGRHSRHGWHDELLLVAAGHGVAGATAGLVGLGAPHHNRGRIVARGAVTDEALIAARRVAAPHADRVELVDHFGHGEQLRHRAE